MSLFIYLVQLSIAPASNVKTCDMASSTGTPFANQPLKQFASSPHSEHVMLYAYAHYKHVVFIF